MTVDAPLTDEEFKMELIRLHIEALRQQHDNRHIDPEKYHRAKKVSQQLRLWKCELDTEMRK
jgi:hypothetical protein